MNLEQFSREIEEKMNLVNINITDNQIQKFYNYMNLLIEWNNKINLTAIVDPKDIIIKHFIDSVTILKYIEKGQNMVDVGTGAGFPGVALNIMNSDINYVLVDSLNKRIKYLEEVIKLLELKNIKAIHARVEDFGRDKNNREIYDIATSRAVAQLNVLLEYLLPLVKVGGKCICMKGSNIGEEIQNSSKALEVLGGQIEKIEEICLPESEITRNIIIIKKIRKTPCEYPRKAGTAKKEPI